MMVGMANDDEAAERDELDRYYTDTRLAQAQMIRARSFGCASSATLMLEPSSGKGSYIAAARGCWGQDIKIHAIDLDPAAEEYAKSYGAIFFHGDFLELGLGSNEYELIAGNPPFSRPLRDPTTKEVMRNAKGKVKREPIARSHVERMLDRLAVDGVCSVLLRASFLHTSDRYDLFRKRRPKHVDFVVERPSFTGGGTDNYEYAVIYWERRGPRRWAEETTSDWLSW
jgi:hypothetical protein